MSGIDWIEQDHWRAFFPDHEHDHYNPYGAEVVERDADRLVEAYEEGWAEEPSY